MLNDVPVPPLLQGPTIKSDVMGIHDHIARSVQYHLL
jgi:hypothetical protein